MRNRNIVIIGLLSLWILFSCSMQNSSSGSNSSGSGNSSSGTVIATEVWQSIYSSTTGSFTLKKYSDGTITVSGSWTNGGAYCPFTDGTVTIDGMNLSFSGSGTAHYGSSSSPFTVKTINFIATNGFAYGYAAICFTATDWQSSSTTNSMQGYTHQRKQHHYKYPQPFHKRGLCFNTWKRRK